MKMGFFYVVFCGWDGCWGCGGVRLLTCDVSDVSEQKGTYDRTMMFCTVSHP